MNSSAAQMQLPSSPPTVPAVIQDELLLVKLAREVAMEIKPLQTIIKNFGLSPVQWEDVRTNDRFNRILAAEIEVWGQASSTAERVKIKSAAMIEEFLPEAYARLIDNKENLNHKVELMKTVVGLAQLGGRNFDHNADPGKLVTVTINLGADHQLNYQQRSPEPATIDITPNTPATPPMQAGAPTSTDDPSVSGNDFEEA